MKGSFTEVLFEFITQGGLFYEYILPRQIQCKFSFLIPSKIDRNGLVNNFPINALLNPDYIYIWTYFIHSFLVRKYSF